MAVLAGVVIRPSRRYRNVGESRVKGVGHGQRPAPAKREVTS
jgi:hypothetical protein